MWWVSIKFGVLPSWLPSCFSSMMFVNSVVGKRTDVNGEGEGNKKDESGLDSFWSLGIVISRKFGYKESG